MAYVARFEDPEALLLLQGLVRRAVEKAEIETRRYTDTFREQLQHCDDVLAHVSVDGDSPPLRAKPKAAPTPRKAKDLPPPKLCSLHPSYAAMRTPRTDCEQCWAAYERLNPTRAPNARRKRRMTNS